MEYVERARAETDRGELVLRERVPDEAGPTVLELRANGVFVMDTAEVSTERALASAALALVDSPTAVVVGGLGLGFTLREVLDDPRVGTCAIVEIETDLVDWMRDGTIAHGPALLADARLSVVVADIALAVAEARSASYDLVLLDVDNGPGYLVHDANAELYAASFLHEVARVLRPGGAAAIWSAAEAPELATTLAAVFEKTETIPLDVVLQSRPERYWLYVGRVTADQGVSQEDNRTATA